MVLFQNCVRQSCSPTKMTTTVQLHCYWKQLWSRWAITGSWEPLVTNALSQATNNKCLLMLCYISLQKGFCLLKLCQKTSRHVLAYGLLQATINKIVLMLCHWPFPASFCLCFVTEHHWKGFSYALPQATLNKFLPVHCHSPLQHMFALYALSIITNVCWWGCMFSFTWKEHGLFLFQGLHLSPAIWTNCVFDKSLTPSYHIGGKSRSYFNICSPRSWHPSSKYRSYFNTRSPRSWHPSSKSRSYFNTRTQKLTF